MTLRFAKRCAGTESEPKPFSCEIKGAFSLTRELAVCRTNSADFLRIIPLTNRDHKVQLGVAWKMVDVRLSIRSVMVQCLHCLLIQPMIMMCGPTWNSLPLPMACDLFVTQKPPYIYEIPALSTLGVRPAILSFMNSRKT